jgi:hypothetical protein
LFDDVANAHVGAKIVARYGDGDAEFVEPARVDAMKALIDGLPVAAVDVHHGGAGAGFEQVECVAFTFAVADHAWRFGFAIRGAVAGPAGDNARVLRYARAIVVFGLVVDAHFESG